MSLTRRFSRLRFALRIIVDQMLARCGYSPTKQLNEVRSRLNVTESLLAKCRSDLDERKHFICESLAPLTNLAPEFRWTGPVLRHGPDVSSSTVQEVFSGQRRDVVLRVSLPAAIEMLNHQLRYEEVDHALRYISESVAYQIEKQLRFGLGANQYRCGK